MKLKGRYIEQLTTDTYSVVIGDFECGSNTCEAIKPEEMVDLVIESFNNKTTQVLVGINIQNFQKCGSVDMANVCGFVESVTDDTIDGKKCIKATIKTYKTLSEATVLIGTPIVVYYTYPQEVSTPKQVIPLIKRPTDFNLLYLNIRTNI